MRIDQPHVYGGARLLEFVDIDALATSTSAANVTQWTLSRLAPREQRRLRVRVFGIDPSATAAEEERADVAASLQQQSEVSGGACQCEVGDDACAQGSAMYQGRLLSADFVIAYTADVEGEGGERYERTETLRLAVTVAPALTVVEWHMVSIQRIAAWRVRIDATRARAQIAGDTPTTRFVVVDVTNLADADGECDYGYGMLTRRSRRVGCSVAVRRRSFTSIFNTR